MSFRRLLDSTCLSSGPRALFSLGTLQRSRVGLRQCAKSVVLGFKVKPFRLSAPKLQRFLRFAIAMATADPRNRAISETEDKAMLHCDLRVRWKVASDLRFGAAMSEPETRSFCGISGDLAPSTRKSLAIAMVQFWCAKV